MANRAVYVVGDGFKNFSDNYNVYTFSQIINIIKENSNLNFGSIIIGQGISSNEKSTLSIMSSEYKIYLVNEQDLNTADSRLTHKHKLENGMITEPFKQQDEQTYLSWLFINDDCAEMNDHMTGQHLQGMVLTEAARQMMLAVAEKYLLEDKDKGNSYCALLSVNAIFHKFAFPIDTSIKHSILIFYKNNNGKYQAKTRTEFYQNSELVTHVDISYIFNNEAMLLEKEKSMAKSLVESRLAYQMSEKLNMVA